MRPFPVLTAGLLMLSACAASDKYARIIADSTPPSPAIKLQLVGKAKDLLYDPASVRDAEISNVATLPDGLQGVCVRADSKNVDGVYIGRQNLGIAIRDGKLQDGTLNHPICNRADVAWQPFPELNTLDRR